MYITKLGGYCHLAFPGAMGTCSQVLRTPGLRQGGSMPYLVHPCPHREVYKVSVPLIKMIQSFSPLGLGSLLPFAALF